MLLHDTLFICAGAVGSMVAVIHGVIVQRKMVSPMIAMTERHAALSRPIRELLGPLLQSSAYTWLVCGTALVGATLWASPQAAFAIALLSASQFVYGALYNLRATRGRHPGGWLMLIAVAMISISASGAV